MGKASIVLMSDFGACNGTAAMSGIVKCVDPMLSTYTLTHEVPHFDVKTASALLNDQLGAWPKGAVFVCAVDPAVGTDQRVVAVWTEDGYVLVAPDNGCLTDAVRDHGAKEVRDLSLLNGTYTATEQSNLYHGRNLAFCAAAIASEKRNVDEIGPLCPADGLKRI